MCGNGFVVCAFTFVVPSTLQPFFTCILRLDIGLRVYIAFQSSLLLPPMPSVHSKQLFPWKSQWRFALKRRIDYNQKYMHRIHFLRLENVWCSFLRSTGLLFAEYVVQFDFNDVINTLDAEECEVLVETIKLLQYLDVPFIGCSKGTKHIESILERGHVYQSVVDAMDGWIFTRNYWWDKSQDISEISNLQSQPHRPDRIVVNADKGFLSKTLGIPSILFDDKEQNADAHNKEHPLNRTILVKRYRKARHMKQPEYREYYDPHASHWFWQIVDWEEDICAAEGVPLVNSNDVRYRHFALRV